jgi:hypothetical protein
MFVQIFFLALNVEKLNKLLDQLNISRIRYPVSGLTGYPAEQSGIRPDTGYPVHP